MRELVCWCGVERSEGGSWRGSSEKGVKEGLEEREGPGWWCLSRSGSSLASLRKCQLNTWWTTGFRDQSGKKIDFLKIQRRLSHAFVLFVGIKFDLFAYLFLCLCLFFCVFNYLYYFFHKVFCYDSRMYIEKEKKRKIASPFFFCSDCVTIPVDQISVNIVFFVLSPLTIQKKKKTFSILKYWREK